GHDPYPEAIRLDSTPSAIRAAFADLPAGTRTTHRVGIAGRLVAKRDMGGLCFGVLRDFDGEIQLLLHTGGLGHERMVDFKRMVDLGDHVTVQGAVITSRHGELSVDVSSWQLAAKCLHPLPDKRKGLTDPEARVRQRYLDLMMNARSREMLTLRSAVIRSVRDYLHGLYYLEVETPMLQSVHGGANARPFVTHMNAYDMRLYLRIAPELYLKRLCVAGVDRLFELNRNFRNEGVDAAHNPEFTMVEAYQAYGDYRSMRTLVRELIQSTARRVHGAEVARLIGGHGRPEEVDLSGEWPVVTVYDAVSAALGTRVSTETGAAVLLNHCRAAGVEARPDASAAELVLAAYEQLVEANTVLPTFYTDFPAEVCPLTRPHAATPALAQRWDLVAFSAEIATAYSELTDPRLQRARLAEQSFKAASGDVEAMELDEEFLRALEYGMPPTGGFGMGIDRLVMMLTGASIRQAVTFPFLRERS
ncbi:MAG: bifunctional lysylphosphatidylglycerol synthetase/lysine--tRNA ligase LysX, partial [Sciscionella sp.]